MSQGGFGGQSLLVSRITGKCLSNLLRSCHAMVVNICLRIEEATEEKCKLEQKQREEAKERKETGGKWENR